MPGHYDEVLNGAPPDLGRNLDFLMNLLPMLARAGNSANPQDVFKEFVNDPQTGSFQSFADQAGLPEALGVAMELLGPDVTGNLGDVAKFATLPGFFRMLQRNPELGGQITDFGALLQRNGAEIELHRLPDDTVEVARLRRGEERGSGSQLKQIVNEAAQQQQVSLRGINAPFGPGDFSQNFRANEQRFIQEGYEQLPDGSWILRAKGRAGGGVR